MTDSLDIMNPSTAGRARLAMAPADLAAAVQRLSGALDVALADELPFHREVAAAEAECGTLGRSFIHDPTDRLRTALDAQAAVVTATDAVIAEIAALPRGGDAVLRLKARAAHERRGSEEADNIARAIVAQLAGQAA